LHRSEQYLIPEITISDTEFKLLIKQLQNTELRLSTTAQIEWYLIATASNDFLALKL
jgi:hypothetical protein